MDRDRWKDINRIFHAALDLSTSERHEFVAKASAGDSTLAEEIILLLKADEDAGSYIESPLMDSSALRSFRQAYVPSFGPGDTLCDRFKIMRELGEGGMGQVFEAVDTELGVQIALKLIRPDIASSKEALARFKQEVRLARRITHPNVCRTFDLEMDTRVEEGGEGPIRRTVFLTMEYLQGETLASRIKREGALQLDEAQGIACQVAGALQAASALGVVHRDIKPGNIMLVTEVGSNSIRAKIMDFGLARIDEPAFLSSISGIGNTATPLGTLAYMAPEQLSSGEVSTATDVYAFGLVLFEMVTGKRAFPSDTLLSGIAQRLSGAPPDAAAIVPSLPDGWRRAIEGCLRAKPEDRFASAADVLAVLRGQRKGKHTWIVPRIKLSKQRTVRWSPARSVAAFLIICAALALLWSGLRYSRVRADSRVPLGALVYLAPVKNDTGEEVLNNITELIQAGLTQSVRINLLDQGRVGDTLQRMTRAPDTVIDQQIAREIALRTGAVRVVFVTVDGSAGKYNLHIDVQQPDYQTLRFRRHSQKSFGWRSKPENLEKGSIPQELAATIRDASNWIRLEVGESMTDIVHFDVPPEDVTTDSWSALANYVRSNKLSLDRRPELSVVALQDAVTEDPKFALAYARLGDILVSMDRTEEGYHAYERALDPSIVTRLTRRERDRIRGMYAIDTGDYLTAEKAFRDYSEFYEIDYLGWAYRSYPLKMLGRTDEAIAVLREAIAIDPSRSFAPSELARYLLIEGKFDEALLWTEQLKKNGHTESALYVEASLLFLQSRFDQAAEKLRQLIASTHVPTQSDGYSLDARLVAERGDSAEAIEILSRGIIADQGHGNRNSKANKLLDRAYLECKMKMVESCLENLREIRTLSKSPQTIMAASAILGSSLVQANPEIAGSLRAELYALSEALPKENFGLVSELMRTRLRGEVLLCQGRTGEALEQFRMADKLDAPAGAREYLGRALLSAATVANPTKARALRQEALSAYGAIALKPGMVWHDAIEYPPGFLADEMSAYLHTAGLLNKSDSSTKRCVETLLKLRGAGASSATHS